MVHALHDLFDRIGLAAPAIDLGPAGHARLDTMARKIALDRLIIELVGGLGLQSVGAGADDRQLPLEHVEQLRQLVDRGLADEPADAGHARVPLGDQLGGPRVQHVGPHRAELVDADQLIVEAVARLHEKHRPPALDLDGDGRHQHHR
ncbi:hypothetical protein D3C87_1673620 [compost metagenome]